MGWSGLCGGGGENSFTEEFKFLISFPRARERKLLASFEDGKRWKNRQSANSLTLFLFIMMRARKAFWIIPSRLGPLTPIHRHVEQEKT
jgi:hypothetical protein